MGCLRVTQRVAAAPQCRLTDPMTLLTADELAAALANLPGWGGSTTAIQREFLAPDFPTGIQLVVQAAQEAEELDHHPDIDIRWVRVLFVLSTHSAGGVTDLDISLARRISERARALGCD